MRHADHEQSRNVTITITMKREAEEEVAGSGGKKAKVEALSQHRAILQERKRFEEIQERKDRARERIEAVKAQFRELGWTDAEIETGFQQLVGLGTSMDSGVGESGAQVQSANAAVSGAKETNAPTDDEQDDAMAVDEQPGKASESGPKGDFSKACPTKFWGSGKAHHCPKENDGCEYSHEWSPHLVRAKAFRVAWQSGLLSEEISQKAEAADKELKAKKASRRARKKGTTLTHRFGAAVQTQSAEETEPAQ